MTQAVSQSTDDRGLGFRVQGFGFRERRRVPSAARKIWEGILDSLAPCFWFGQMGSYHMISGTNGFREAQTVGKL